MWILSEINKQNNNEDQYEENPIIISSNMILGRQSNNDIVVQDQHVARKHLKFTMLNEQLWVQDLNSVNGTRVNGQYITEQTELHSQDEIRVGQMIFRVMFTEESENIENDNSIEQQVIDKLMNNLTQSTVNSNNNKHEHNNFIDTGMPTLADRKGDVELNRGGMPVNMNIPIPAPIPQDAPVQAQEQEINNRKNINRIENVVEQQKNAKVGLITIIVILLVSAIFIILLTRS